MAEAIALAASLVGLIQLAGQVTAIGYTYISGVKRAANDLHDLSRELSILNLVLFALQKYVDANPQFSMLQTLNSSDGPLQKCESELKALLAKIEPKNGFKGVLNSIKWPLKEAETMQHITRIERQKSLLMLALETDNMSLTQEIHHVQKTDLAVQRIRKISETLNSWANKHDTIQADEDRRDVLAWLYSEDFDRTHLEICNERQKGTGTWLLEEPSFREWAKKQPGSSLLCGYGIPGAGKTFLSSVVIDYLEVRASTERFGVTYFYFNFKEQCQGPTQFLASLVKQLTCKLPKLPSEVDKLYKELVKEAKRPSLDQLNALLRAVSKNFAQVFIIVDALDECAQEQRIILLPLFHRLGQDGFNMFLTSRPHPEDIQESFRNVKKIIISARDQDIRLFINQKIEGNTRARRLVRQAGLQDRIVDDIVGFANGMFLLVRFHVEFICQQVSAKQVLKALASLKMAPKKNPLDPTYERIVNFIRGQPQSNMELALSILSWIIKARRILRLNELQTAISVEPETYELDELNLPDKDVILDICGGLVTVDESENVRFVHYTVQEYLVNNRIIPEDSDLTTALTCITYLSFDVFTANCNEDPVSPYKLRLIYPFLGYASRYLYSHLRSCEENLTADALVYHLEKQGHSLSYLYYTLHEEVSPLQMAAKLGHCLAFQMLLDNGHNISVCDGDGNTVLHYVAMAESKEMAKFLLNKKAVSIMALNDNGRSPLMIAALRGNDEIARILIDHGANIFDQDFYGTTVAGLAASNGHCALMQLLIENGVDPTGGSDSCWSPFESAILTGHEKVVELLIQRINFADLPLRPDSLLIDAIEFGYRGIARMLIEKGYDLSSQNREGSTALHWAAFSDWEDIVRLMLERGADISVRSTSTRLLFSNITKRDNHIMFGKTALEIAISEGHDSIEAILVAEMKDLTGDELIQQDEAPVLPILDSQYIDEYILSMKYMFGAI